MNILAGLVGKTCRYDRCGKRFVSKPKAHGQRFCSDSCRHKHYFKTVYYPRHIQPKRPRWITRYCKNARCGVRFTVSGRGKGGTRRKYCTVGCQQSHLNRLYRERLKKAAA